MSHPLQGAEQSKIADVLLRNYRAHSLSPLTKLFASLLLEIAYVLYSETIMWLKIISPRIVWAKDMLHYRVSQIKRGHAFQLITSEMLLGPSLCFAEIKAI